MAGCSAAVVGNPENHPQLEPREPKTTFRETRYKSVASATQALTNELESHTELHFTACSELHVTVQGGRSQLLTPVTHFQHGVSKTCGFLPSNPCLFTLREKLLCGRAVSTARYAAHELKSGFSEVDREPGQGCGRTGWRHLLAE